MFFMKWMADMLENKFKKEKPDIVHIHGIGTITESYIRICEEMKVRYTVTYMV